MLSQLSFTVLSGCIATPYVTSPIVNRLRTGCAGESWSEQIQVTHGINSYNVSTNTSASLIYLQNDSDKIPSSLSSPFRARLNRLAGRLSYGLRANLARTLHPLSLSCMGLSNAVKMVALHILLSISELDLSPPQPPCPHPFCATTDDRLGAKAPPPHHQTNTSVDCAQNFYASFGAPKLTSLLCQWHLQSNGVENALKREGGINHG